MDCRRRQRNDGRSIAENRWKAVTGKAAEARRDLGVTAASVEKKGFVLRGLEARVAIAEIEIKSGAVAAGKSHLAAIEKDARKKGFKFVSFEAATVRG